MGETRGEKKLVEVIYQPYGLRIKIQQGITILDAARALGLGILSLCDGKGTCGKCKVLIQKGRKALDALTEAELKRLSEEEIKGNYRLACRIPLTTNMTVFVPDTSEVGKQRLQAEGIQVPVNPNPMVKKFLVKMPRATLEDQRSDEDRLLDALEEQHGFHALEIDYEALQTLPFAIRIGDWTATVVIWDERRVIAIESGDTTDRCFGLAVDVGTTKLAGFLIDLTKGKVVGSSSKMNPQIPFGEDVISRITHAMGGLDKLLELQDAVKVGINGLIENVCKQASVLREEIYEITSVGNTCMQTLLLGLWPKHMGLSPYPPVVKRGVNVKASKLGLKVHRNANLHQLPVIGGFVGADNVAVMLATEMLESEEMTLTIDIGTNTEIDLGNRNDIMVCSCASGPAFEGMHIKHGMRAASGAIEKISVDPENFEVYYRTIDNSPPVGICGSALVDVPSEFLKARIIDTAGRFNKELEKDCPRIRKKESDYEFILAFGKETAMKRDIVVTQGDIRELQKAKGAIYAGAAILMKRMGVTVDKIDKLVIAGAFGNYVDPDSARTIGMYPEIPLNKVVFVGNAAGTGARMALISREAREKAQGISKRVRYHELSVDPDFAMEFANSMYLPNGDLDRFPVTRELLQRLGCLSLKS